MIIKRLFEHLENSPNFKKIALLIKLFRQAIKGEQDEDVESKLQRYFQDPDDYSHVIQFTLLRLPGIIKEYYQIDFASTLKMQDIESHIQQVLIRGFLIKSLQFLEKTIETSESETIIFVIRAIGSLNNIATAYDSIQKKCIKLLIKIWGDHLDLKLKLSAFIEIRKIFSTLPDYQQADIIKKFYEKYIVIGKHVVWRNYEGINFMINCIVELCNMNMNQAYQVGFSCLQKLVIRLRDASKQKNEQNIQSINNQQTLSIIRLWTEVICVHKLKNQLQDLMPAMVQIIQSLLDFYPSIDNYPFQLHLTQQLIKIAQTFKVNLNLVPYLLEMLNCVEFKRRKLKTSAKPYDFDIGINIKQKHRQSGQFWSDLCQKIINQLIVYFAIFQKQKWFYEYSLFLEKQLKRVSNQFGFTGNKINIRQFIKLIENHQQSKDQKESNLTSRAQQILFDQEELIKQKVLSEKEREENGEELEESQQEEINDEQDQEYVMDEIRKYKEEKQKEQDEGDMDIGSDYEGDPEIQNDQDDY